MMNNGAHGSVRQAFAGGTGRSGFTILELVIAASIAMIVFGVGYLAISSTVKAGNQSAERIQETENVRLFFNLLERDLNAGFPGPGNLQKGPDTPHISIVGGAPPYLSLAYSPMTITEQTNKSTPANDLLQFYTRTEHPGAGADEYQFVRYFVNRQDYTLCRQAVPCHPSDPNFAANLPDKVDPFNPSLTASPTNENALFDNLRSLTIVYKRWNPDTRMYVTEGQPYNALTGSLPALTPATCDAILVTLVFTDSYKLKDLESASEYGKRISAADYEAAHPDTVNKIRRSYSRMLSIPASFKQ